jgi:hypothetical protein
MSLPATLTDRRDTPYSVEFFDLQLCFAKRVAEITGKPAGDTVGSYTNIYVRLAMGRQLDPTNPEWQQYLAAVSAAPEQAAWTHEVHLQRLHLAAGPTPVMTVGCFSYELVGADRARLHFHSAGSDSPLSAEHRVQRLQELAGLFAHLKASSSDGLKIVGASWLYNLDRYRSLFPERYLTSLRTMEHPYQRMPLWGQFLNRDRSVRSDARLRFLADIARASSVSELSRCFPFGVLFTTAPAAWFYEHLGL